MERKCLHRSLTLFPERKIKACDHVFHIKADDEQVDELLRGKGCEFFTERNDIQSVDSKTFNNFDLIFDRSNVLLFTFRLTEHNRRMRIEGHDRRLKSVLFSDLLSLTDHRLMP